MYRLSFGMENYVIFLRKLYKLYQYESLFNKEKMNRNRKNVFRSTSHID